MKLISFNINSVRARLHQLDELIRTQNPDVIGLQETKAQNSDFPCEAIKEMGYESLSHGQKGHYGVGLLFKEKPVSVQYGFKTDDENSQKRMIIAKFKLKNGENLHVFNGYFPQGDNQNNEIKFPAKLKFYQDLNLELQNYKPTDNIVLMGDVNISRVDLDIGIGEKNAKRWLQTKKCSFLPIEREIIQKLMDFGFYDSFRELYPDADDKFSWFDYRSFGFKENRGLRIDLILLTKSLLEKQTKAGIDYHIRSMEKPSDHAPIYSELKF